MCSYWQWGQFVWDYMTYHHSALLTGSSFNRAIKRLFEDRQIEDLWIPYFCVSTDITDSEMRIHRRGSLWSYVRASMSLATYLPPLCDPVDGHLLLDGGYVNNVPADVMQQLGARFIVAVDVGTVNEGDLFDYGEQLSGTWVLFNKWNPWRKTVRVLDIQDIQSRLAYVSSCRQLDAVKKNPHCQYVRPTIDAFQTLAFGKFDEIHAIGYEHGREWCRRWVANDERLQSIIFPRRERLLARRPPPTKIGGFERSPMTSFTDLAAAFSRVPGVRRDSGFEGLDDNSDTGARAAVAARHRRSVWETSGEDEVDPVNTSEEELA